MWYFCPQVGDLGKKGWSTLAGSNVSSPTDGYGSSLGNGNNSISPSASAYQTSAGRGGASSFDNGDTNWGEDSYNSNNS